MSPTDEDRHGPGLTLYGRVRGLFEAIPQRDRAGFAIAVSIIIVGIYMVVRH